ncbi:hypothetical protein ACM66T_10040 [Sulfurimonas sp. ST-25]|uniref:deoxynucleotide monophosphate kinase family protein n=1 Tax=Sulfurimonas sp. ST-25 TaxID=3400151 RepID=UPI003A8C6CBC
MKRVILIGHKKRQGKDTLAQILAEITGGKIVRFADPIKEILADTFGVPVSELEDAKNDEEWVTHPFPSRYDQSYRDMLQRFGQAIKKQFEEDVWAGLATEKVWDCDTDIVIIPDLRFEVEYLAMKRAFLPENVTTVNVTRPGAESLDMHESETELDGFTYDHVIVNDGTIEDLRVKALNIMEGIDVTAAV